MSSSEIADPVLSDAAEVLQEQLVYNGDVLDIAMDSLKAYKPGTQSLAYLDSSVYLAYALMRMLEKWGKAKGDGTYVRKKTKKQRKNKSDWAISCFNSTHIPTFLFFIAISEEDGIPDVEEIEDDDDEIVHETLFTFDAFESVIIRVFFLFMFLITYSYFSEIRPG